MATKSKRKMSKRLKNMKFMKRKSNTEKRKTKQNDKKAKIEAMQWIQSEAAESNLIIDDRRDEYMMYRTGRKSFGNFNTAVERMQNDSINTIMQHQASKTKESNDEDGDLMQKTVKIKSSSSSNSKNEHHHSNDDTNNNKDRKRKVNEICDSESELGSVSVSNPTKRQKTCPKNLEFIRPEPLQ